MSVVGAVMDYIFDWEADGDRFSFEDSDRFEEDSLCSWISEPESLCNNWRGWRKQNGGGAGAGAGGAAGATAIPGVGGTVGGPPGLGNAGTGSSSLANEGEVSSLMDLAAQAVARHLPFEVVEHFYQPIPEQLQLRIAFWSFPENEEDIRLYSCLANGSSDEFQRGEMMFKNKSVHDALQIGFHLSATVTPPMSSTQVKGSYNVALVFDRRHITSCTCSCSPHGSTASWCAHVVALCLFRIHQSSQVCLRAPVSESLSRLERDQLQKFAQYLISELPQQILPTAQRLLDELLSSQKTMINTVCGAPDPTAGPSAGEQTTWCLDEVTLHENIKKTLVKFCVPSPVVLSDVNYLSNNAPPAANEWQSLLRPLRGREPEGIWNLLLIVREMFRRSDNNAIPLLEILTEEILACEQIVVWWFNNKTQTQNSIHNTRSINQNNTHSSQHAASSLCDEIVTLWRLAALNPALSSALRSGLCSQLKEWHVATIEKLRKSRNSNGIGHSLQAAAATLRKSDIDAFTGFKPAIEACHLEWNDYLLIGFTRNISTSWIGSLSRMRSEGEGNRMAHAKGYGKSPVSCTINVTDGLNLIRGPIRAKMVAAEAGGVAAAGGQRKGLYSSGSEGFSEGERRPMVDSGEDHISTETVVGSSEDGGTVKDGAEPRPACLERSADKSEDVDSDCGSLPSTPGFQAGSTGPAVFNGSKESPSGSLSTSNGSQGATGGGECVDQPSWDNQKLDSTSSTPPDAGVVGGLAVAVNPQLQQEASAKASSSSTDKGKSREHNYFAGVRKPENKQEIMFALAEALHAHGHVRESGRLARELAEEMITSGPDAGVEYTAAAKDKKKRVLQAYNSATLSNASFLCSVLLEDLDCRHLAFRIGLFGLEMARTPATSKSLEVKLAHQESELVIQLKKIPLGAEEMAIIRDRAEKLRDGKLKSRGEALLPITLASFIFDSLCLPANKASVGGAQTMRSGPCVTPVDEKLGFEAAVAALGLKANVSEAEHPLLCEGTRRQKGELAVAMLVHYKDDPQKLARIMDKLLDKEVHQLYRNAPATSCSASSNGSSASEAGLGLLGNAVANAGSDCHPQNSDAAMAPSGGGGGGAKEDVATLRNMDQPSIGRVDGAVASATATVSMKPKPIPPASKDTDSSAMEEDVEGSSDYKAWEAKFRCANLRTTKKHSVGMASVDSSAPETTSSDNSPTLIRRNAATGHHGALVHHGPGSDSGSSHKSSDSVGSSGCDFQGVAKTGDNDSPPSAGDGVALPPVNIIYSRSSTPNVKGARYKGKNRVMPVVPNQPSEASAHFMFELAKTVLVKAGGSSSTSLFVNQSAANNTNPTGPHRALHLCAFQIGLYALGLNNFVLPNWLTRTYSSHVSWITGQATEIGCPAINILIKTWEGHLTPQEVASLADRASRCRDPNMVRAAAELALSCLPHAQELNPNEIQRALIQCKEQGKDMLQRACLSVEMAAKEGGVYPEVLFEVAKRWYELYEEALHGPLQPGASASGAVDRNAGPLRGTQRTSDGTTGGGTGPIPIVHVVRDQSVPGMLNPGPLVASAALCAPGQMGTYPPGGALPMPPMSYALPAGQQFQVLHPFLAPQYAYVQSIAPPSFGHYYGIPAPHIPHSQPMHLAKYPYTGGQPPYVPSNLGPAFNPGVRPPPPFHPVAFVTATTSVGGSQQPGGGGPAPTIANWGLPPASYGLLQPVEGSQQAQQTAPLGGQQQGAAMGVPGPAPMDPGNMSSPVQINYLLAAYRVGMLAMETLARRVHDDRPQIKYARNPPYGEDVKWLHGIAMKLGTSYLQQFCASTVNTIVSPFILLDIAMESANFMAGNNVTQVPQQLRLPMLSSLLQRCLQMFIQCTHTRIHHITQVDYDEFVSIVCSARNAFCMTPDGLTQFNEMLQGLRRSKSCKRELWQRIISALHNSSSI